VRTLDHLFARRVSRRSAVQLFGAAPVLAHGALAAGPTALRSAHSAPPATTAAADRLFEAGQFVAADAAYARAIAKAGGVGAGCETKAIARREQWPRGPRRASSRSSRS
jgi:hypothetical protein